MTQHHDEEDARIRQLFSRFDPPMPVSPDRFMERLERSMRAVEFVKEQNRAIHRSNRTAIAIAAITGFLTGVLLTLLAPVLARLTAGIEMSLFTTDSIRSAYTVYRVVVWIIVAATSALTAVNAYEISMSRIRARENKKRP